MFRMLGLLGFILSISIIARGAEPVPFRIKSACVFKDGTAWVVTECKGAVPDENGVVRTKYIPSAFLGTLSVDAGQRLIGFALEKTNAEEAFPVGSLNDLLLANQGARVELTLSSNPTNINGVIERFILTADPREQEMSNYQRNMYAQRYSNGDDDENYPAYMQIREFEKRFISMVIIRNDKGVSVIYLNNILGINFTEPDKIKFETKKGGNIPSQLAISVKGKEPIDIEISCLRGGLRWIPSYRIKIPDANTMLSDGKAFPVKLELSAELLADGMD
jgi:hypothetical protein